MRSGLVQVINGWDSKEIAEGVFLETSKDMFMTKYVKICADISKYFLVILNLQAMGRQRLFLIGLLELGLYFWIITIWQHRQM